MLHFKVDVFVHADPLAISYATGFILISAFVWYQRNRIKRSVPS